MIGRFLLRLVAKVVARPVRRKLYQFQDATHTPEQVQAQLLQEILTYQRDTGFGKDHGFGSIKTIADYRKQVPVGPYEYVAPYIDRVKKGDIKALLNDPKVMMFALTSGTTAARKHIPITERYLDDYRRGWNIWGLMSFVEHKNIVFRPVVQLVGDPEEYLSDGGIPCGNLSGLTAQVQKRIVKLLYRVPAISGKIKDSTVRYYIALRCSLTRKIGLLSAANPSTLVALARVMDQEKESLIRDIHDGTLSTKLDLPPDIRKVLEKSRRMRANRARAKELQSFVEKRGALLPMDVWPAESMLIGCWTGGSVGPYLRQLPKFYGTTPVRDIGLLASEGRMTIPIQDATPAGVLDITSHYFEFIPEDEIDSANPTVLGTHEVQEGGSYYILPTTKSGLYRYHISDLVRVTGFYNKTPLVEFLGKGNRFANLTGEKLSEYQVCRAMDATALTIPQPITAYSLAPCWDDVQPYYGLFLEEQDVQNPRLLNDFLLKLDHQLGEENIEYAAKRDSGRLGPIRAEVIPTGTWTKWDRERLARNGGSPEQYKHPCLIGDMDFLKSMPVQREIELEASSVA